MSKTEKDTIKQIYQGTSPTDFQSNSLWSQLTYSYMEKLYVEASSESKEPMVTE